MKILGLNYGDDYQSVEQEKEILKDLNHPHIIKLFEAHFDKRLPISLVLVFECCKVIFSVY